MKLPYRIMTVNGTVPGEHWTRYAADKALQAMNESAWLLQNSMAIDTNHDVFPLEPESPWIPVTSRLPRIGKKTGRSENCLVTDGKEIATGRLYVIGKLTSWAGVPLNVTHWQPLPNLP